jgi:hypothetical protein
MDAQQRERSMRADMERQRAQMEQQQAQMRLREQADRARGEAELQRQAAMERSAAAPPRMQTPPPLPAYNQQVRARTEQMQREKQAGLRGADGRRIRPELTPPPLPMPATPPDFNPPRPPVGPAFKKGGAVKAAPVKKKVGGVIAKPKAAPVKSKAKPMPAFKKGGMIKKGKK